MSQKTERSLYDLYNKMNKELVGFHTHLAEMERSNSRQQGDGMIEASQQGAILDELTRIANRHSFLEIAQEEIQRAIHYHHTLVISLIDIDYFTSIIAVMGQVAGEQALLAVTKVCQENIRLVDVLARFGEGEFVILHPQTSLEQASTVVEKIRKILSTLTINFGGKPGSITISSGITCLECEHESLEGLLKKAEWALTRAQKAGRNHIVTQY